MGTFVASQVVKQAVNKNIKIRDAKALILGFTFKENCPDFRNTRIIDIYGELTDFGMCVSVFDPWVDKTKVIREYEIERFNQLDVLKEKYEIIIIAVPHKEFRDLDYSKLRESNSVLIDIKGLLQNTKVDFRL